MAEKKLLLINPQTENNPKFKFFPPISLGIIEALTPQNWTITIIDENLEEITSFDYDLVAITATHNINRAYSIAEMFKRKSIPVILGGRHVTALPDEAIKYANAIVVGEVEPVWELVIKDFEAGNLKNLYESNKDSNNFIEPAINHFNNKYFSYTLETSRGCINNCRFCGIHIPVYRPYKRKPIEMVIKELKNTKNLFYFIIDNNFYGNDDEYLFTLFDEIIRQKIKKIFFAAVSVGFFKNKKLVAKAAECGLKMVFVGFESDTKQSLKELNKKNYSADNIFEEYKAIIDLSHKNKILVSGIVIIGIENDTEELIHKRHVFFSKLKLDNVACSILSPLPNSYFFKKFRDEGRLFYTNFPTDWIKYDYRYNTFRHDNLSREVIEKYQYEINSSFKPNFKKMLKSLFITKSFRGFLFFYAYAYYFSDYKNYFLHLLLKLFTLTRGQAFPELTKQNNN